MAKKIYVLDTNVLLTDANSIYRFQNNDVIIPLPVLEEIDNFKAKQDLLGLHARSTIRLLEEYRNRGSLVEGVRIGKGKGIISVCSYNRQALEKYFDEDTMDNRIISIGLKKQESSPPNKKVVVISKDVNVRIKCDACGLLSEDYQVEQVVDKREDLYTGFEKILVDDEIIDRTYSGESVFLGKENGVLYPNQYTMLVSSSNEKKSSLMRFQNYDEPLKSIIDYSGRGVWGVKPRNKEQRFALDMLMNAEVPINTLVGLAGCGKSFLCLASALSLVLDQGKYKKILVTKPIVPVGGKDIGYIPGGKLEKLNNWFASIYDNLELLLGNDKKLLEDYFERGIIEFEAMTYMRGRSISDAIIIVDEAQNLNLNEIKTVLTRVGDNSKVVITGDTTQIDNIYINEMTNGLSVVIEKLKGSPLFSNIKMIKGERSKIATLCANVL